MVIYLVKPPDGREKIVVSLDGEYVCVESSPGVCQKLPKDVLRDLLDYWWHKGYEVKLIG
jgi:hypothetical protein